MDNADKAITADETEIRQDISPATQTFQVCRVQPNETGENKMDKTATTIGKLIERSRNQKLGK